jgi:hypothetical protein
MDKGDAAFLYCKRKMLNFPEKVRQKKTGEEMIPLLFQV